MTGSNMRLPVRVAVFLSLQRLFAMSDDRSSQLIILFLVFVVLLNYPVIQIFDRRELWFGIPALYFYFFFTWLVLIVVVGLVVRKKRKS
jgi:hypothetical protein